MLVDRKSPYRHCDDNLNIPGKANRVLNIVLAGMLLIVLRIWHLAIVQYDEKLEESRKPQRRVVLESAKRATIRDRFNIPLALNKVQYNLAVLYSQLKQIPTTTWEIGSDGKRKKVFKRKQYIAALSQLLAKELQMDPERIEDLIHAKASFYHQIPFILKDDISEQEYYRLKMLEKDWLGINVQRMPQRHYPLGKVAGDIIGYMGAINRQEYENIIREIKALETYVDAIDAGENAPLPEGIATADQVTKRLKDLHELAYSINDSIGKFGIEGRFESVLRGFHGKKSYYSDARGNFLRELPGSREPLSGKRLLLSISSELQEFAEQLLIQNEKIRQPRLTRVVDSVKHTIMAQKQPWIKGGAIVVMDPNNGEILTLASFPRIDPNDFISSGNPELNKQKKSNVQKWLETESYLAEVWDQLRTFDREDFDPVHGGIYHEKQLLTWTTYLNIILATDSSLRESVLKNGTINDAIAIQTSLDKLMQLSSQNDAYRLFNYLYRGENYRQYGQKITAADAEALDQQLSPVKNEIQIHKNHLDRYLNEVQNSYDQVLTIDLMRMLVRADLFPQELLQAIGRQPLAMYKEAASSMAAIKEVARKMAKEIFHDIDFRAWRKDNEKEFLKTKRAEEKISKRYARPYIDYLDSLESEQFNIFWEKHRWVLIAGFLTGYDGYPPSDDARADTQLQPYLQHFITWHREISVGAHREIEWCRQYLTLQTCIKRLSPSQSLMYLQTLRCFQELDRPLLGKYRYLRRNSDRIQQEKHLAAAFYHKFGCGYGRSQAYRQASTQGSIFKLVTAYEALVQRYHKLQAAGKDTSNLNPLEMVDLIYYKGKDQYLGYNADGEPLPRFYKGGRLPRSTHSIGKVDLMKALETSSNPYFALLAGDVLNSPQDLANAAKLFSYGRRTGIDLPGEIAGSVPNDLNENRTGLYSLSIGQHTLVVTPLQTSVMLSALANGGKVVKPKIVGMMAGRGPKRAQELASSTNYFPYQEDLALIGIDFPLFVAADNEQNQGLIKYFPSETIRTIFMPDAVHYMLLDSMRRVVVRSHSESLTSLSRLYHNYPEAISDYVELKHQLIGKTSTSESIENIDLDLEQGTNIYTHVWFGGIAFDHDIIAKKGAPTAFNVIDSFGKPELVVVVYLRYGGFGKESAPVAAQIVKKWREIKQKHNNSDLTSRM